MIANLYYCGRMGNRRSDISNRINHLDDKEPKWFAIKTKFKSEKYVVGNLLRKGVEAYIPIQTVTKKYVRKIKTYDKPLMNCYAFVRITLDQYVKVLETEHVYAFIKQGNDLVSIPDQEINLLRKVVGEAEAISAIPILYEAGQSVEIIGGSLTGVKGTLINKKSKRIFVIALDHMGMQLEIEVNKTLIQPINNLKTAI